MQWQVTVQIRKVGTSTVITESRAIGALFVPDTHTVRTLLRDVAIGSVEAIKDAIPSVLSGSSKE